MVHPDAFSGDRRLFLAGLVRGAALAGLAGVSAYLLARPFPAGSGKACPPGIPCGQCRKRTTCRLPQAVVLRVGGLETRPAGSVGKAVTDGQ